MIEIRKTIKHSGLIDAVMMHHSYSKMVFCYKNCSTDQEKLLKFEAEDREFAKISRSLEQFIQAVKGQKFF
jgi:hypothetical protein